MQLGLESAESNVYASCVLEEIGELIGDAVNMHPIHSNGTGAPWPDKALVTD